MGSERKTSRSRFFRILIFSIVFFPLIVFIHNLILSAYSNKDNLVSLFFVRKDNITGEMQGEIYPIAFFKNGKYVDASIEVTENANQATSKRSYLERITKFVVIEKGETLGEFTVDVIQPGQFMCSAILTGRNKKTADTSLLNIFSSINDAKSSCSSGFNQQREFNYALKWTISVSNYKKRAPESGEAMKTDIERYKKELLNIGTSLLTQYKSEGDEKEVFIERVMIFDLDHDGHPEVSAKMRKPLLKKAKVFYNGYEKEEDSHDNVYLNLWVNYKGDDPQIILSLISEQREGSWGTGHDFVGAADVNGDGIDEVIIRNSGWEVVDFEIYEYREGQLIRVFRGAGFGC